MKILWLCSWYPNSADPFDGDFIERHARSLALFQPLDVLHIVQNTSLLKNGKKRIEKRFENNIHTSIVYIPMPAWPLKPLNVLQFNWSYYSVLKQQLNLYIKKNGKPDLVHVHVPAKIGIGAVWLKKKYNIPFVVTEHSTTYFPGTHDQYSERSLYYRNIVKKVFTSAEAFVSVSNRLTSLIHKLFQVKKTYLVRNAVDVEMFFPVQVANPVKRFVHVSMMVPFKNVEGILQALSVLNKTNRNWVMSFVGPASEAHKTLAVDLGLAEQISWEGLLPYAVVAKQIQTGDALVHFSKYENLPCVINEALCCGVPVISSDVGGISEIIDSSNGCLVQNGNVAELAEALNNFLSNPSKFNKQNISARAMAMFRYETIGMQLMELYKEVLNTPD